MDVATAFISVALGLGIFLISVILLGPVQRLSRKVRAHFATPRCIHCRAREDRLPTVCRGIRSVSYFHIIERPLRYDRKKF